MEDRAANLSAIFTTILLIVIILIARLTLKLSKPFYLVFGASLAAIISVFAVLTIRYRFNARRRQIELRFISEDLELRHEYSFLRKVAKLPTKFRHRELEEATDGFRSLIGRGASADVYRGSLTDGTAIAVKRIEGGGHGEKAFKSEVQAIASVQHVNLVRLLGYCIASSGLRFLVYEFIPNGGLNHWIFPTIKGIRNDQNRRGCLSWPMRQQVAIDVAKALSYLHHDCRSCVLHLDVKPENILLDDNYRAFVSDFGLSKLKGKEESRVVTTVRGTRGYLAPEWILENGVSEKCDVYSFGIVLFEMIGGKRSISGPGNGENCKKKFQFFPQIVVEKLREGRIMEVVDERLLNSGLEEEDVKRMALIALWCIQEKARLRPSMRQVVEMLERRAAVEDPPETQMLVVNLLDGSNERPEPRFMSLDRETHSTLGCSFTFSILTGR